MKGEHYLLIEAITPVPGDTGCVRRGLAWQFSYSSWRSSLCINVL